MNPKGKTDLEAYDIRHEGAPKPPHSYLCAFYAADFDCRHLWHELPGHAGTHLALWVPPYDWRDGYSRGGIALDLLSQRVVQIKTSYLIISMGETYEENKFSD